MKSLRFVLSVVLLSLSSAAFAQSDAQKSFDKLKTLAGSWLGTYDADPLHVSLRVTSMGNALIDEMKSSGPENPITMFNPEWDRLLLTHYCDAGNRPRMIGKIAPDGKTVEFDFLDVAGSTQPGHMRHRTFNIIDANHHTEDWTYLLPGDKPEHAHLDLQRTK